MEEDVVLVPLLRGFANNEIVGLKEVMALGRVLGVKVAMQGIIESTHEHRPPSKEAKKLVHYEARIVPFGDLFDEKIIEDPNNNLTTMDALIEVGMVVYFGSKGSDDVWLGRWESAYGVKVLQGPVQKSEFGFRCRTEEEIEMMRSSVRRHRYVGISTFEGVVGLHRKNPGEEWLFPVDDPTPCQRAYMEITKEMERSQKIKDLADDFIDKAFKSRPFVALHVRPYPDTCITLWKDKVWNERYAASVTKCDRVHNGWAVYRILRPAVKSLVDKIESGPNVFVMAEPGIRARVDWLLGGSGSEVDGEMREDVKATYANLDLVLDDVKAVRSLAEELKEQDLAKSKDDEEREDAEATDYFLMAAIKLQAGVISTLGLLEEEIASRAELFVTTSAISSMSGMVIQQRASEGKPNTTTLTFNQLARMNRKDWPWPWSPSSDEFFCYYSSASIALNRSNE